MLAAHILSHKLHPVDENFDSSNFKALINSLVTHVLNNKCLVITATVFAYGVSISLQIGNEVLGYEILGSNGTIEQAIEPGVIGVSYTYPAVSVLHHISAAVYKQLSTNDQNVLKHFLNFTHDLITFILYLTIGAQITNANVSYELSIGTPIITLALSLMIYAAEKIQGQSVLTKTECLKMLTFSSNARTLGEQPNHQNTDVSQNNLSDNTRRRLLC